jgi:hypothetical protein
MHVQQHPFFKAFGPLLFGRPARRTQAILGCFTELAQLVVINPCQEFSRAYASLWCFRWLTAAKLYGAEGRTLLRMQPFTSIIQTSLAPV